MKNLTFLVIALITFASLSSCKKEKIAIKSSDTKDPFAMIMNNFEDSPSDFFVTISSSYGVSVYDQQESSRQPSTIVEAASKNKSNVGTLKVNDRNIPFNTQSYFRQCDTSAFLPSMVLGKNNNYNLSGRNGFPSFNIQQYSPNVTNLSFTGLVDYKLPRNTPLTITWTPDDSMPESSKAIVLIFAEDENTGKIQSVYENVVDGDGSYTIPTSLLSQFDNYPYVRVLYYRGYNKVHNVNNKAIDFRFISFSYSWINFAS